jgi:hypothetical protein
MLNLDRMCSGIRSAYSRSPIARSLDLEDRPWGDDLIAEDFPHSAKPRFKVRIIAPLSLIPYAFFQVSPTQNSKTGKQELTARRLNRHCRPCGKPSSNWSLGLPPRRCPYCRKWICRERK